MTSTTVLADPNYARLKAHLIRATGLAYYADKDGDLTARLARRLEARRLRDCNAYLGLLSEGADGAAELDVLIAELTIGETFFFRHREVFDALRDVAIPDLIARNQSRLRLRVWSAGCSVGAEAYSLAILLRRGLAGALAGWEVEIVGTDVNREFLARAREGCFEEWAMRGTPEDVRRACFDRVGQRWSIRAEYRTGVSFQYHNLVAHSFPSQLHGLSEFDLILCRNVTIYFSPDVVRRITEQFYQSLTDGGWLVVGHAEPNVELFRAFRTINAPGAVLYQKSEGGGERSNRVTVPLVPWSPSPLTWEPPNVPALTPTPLAPRPILPAAPTVDAIRALSDRGEWAEADRCCEELLTRDSLNAAVHFYRGLVLEHLGRHADAESSLRRVVYLDRGNVLAHYYLGLLLQRRGQLSHAVRSFRNALQLLGQADASQVFADGDGITAGELQALTRMHLSALEGT